VVQPRRISDIKPLFTNLAQTSHFLVEFGIGQNRELVNYLQQRGVDSRFIVESAGLLVRDAVIPATSFATMQAIDYMGVIEKFAHTRQFTEMQMEIYVDKDYKTLKFFEHWMEFIASGSHNQSLTTPNLRKQESSLSRKNYVTRYQYPNYYKSNATKITKFERDFHNNPAKPTNSYRNQTTITYRMIDAFPNNITPIPVTYEGSIITKTNVNFTYSRYVIERNQRSARTLNEIQ